MKTDEDDEFDRINRENAMREVQRLGQEIEATGQPYVFATPLFLTDKEILMAYGWKDFQAETIIQQNYREMVLEGLRNIEKEVLKKNKLMT